MMELDLSCCDLSDESMPDDFGCLSSLWMLNLSGNHFVNLPVGCMSNLLKLERLNLSACPTLRSLPKLPPNLAAVHATDCYSMEPLLDPQQLWNLFASHDFQNSSTVSFQGDFVLLINGDEIPSWFHNKNYHCEDTVPSVIDQAISITVDIPDSLRSSEWSGIAVCLALEELLVDPLCLRSINWYFKSPEYESNAGRKWYGIDESYDTKLFIAFFPFNNFNCWRHLRGGLNRLQLTISTKRDSTLTGAPISMTEEDGVLGIKECGWRLLCKEDFEMWRKTVGECNASTSTITSTLRNRRPTVTEVANDNQCQDECDGQHPTQTNFVVAQAPRSFFRTYTWPLFIVCLLLFVSVGVYIFFSMLGLGSQVWVQENRRRRN